MSAEETLYATLNGAAAVTAVVGPRIYLGSVPQEKALPAIAYERLDTEFVNLIHGAVGRTKATVEVWSMASTKTQAASLSALVLAALLPARFFPLGSRPEEDREAPEPIYSTVLTFSIWE